MRRVLLLFVLIGVVGLPASAQKDENNRIKNAGQVMVEILNVPDDIPRDILDKAECVIVLPSVLKAAFIVGGSYGRGVMTCRSGPDFNGRWSAPAMMALEGASFGFQIGGQATDFVLLVMNKRGAECDSQQPGETRRRRVCCSRTEGSQRYSRHGCHLSRGNSVVFACRGLFAGISLAGSTLRPDGDGNGRIYGQGVSAKQIVIDSKVHAPASARLLLATLNKNSPRNHSER